MSPIRSSINKAKPIASGKGKKKKQKPDPEVEEATSEQEEEILQEEEGDMGGAMAISPAGSDMNVPLGAGDGEKICPCPDDGDPVVFSFSVEDFKDMADGEEPEKDEFLDMGDLGIGDEEEDEDPLMENQEESDEMNELLSILQELEKEEPLEEELVVDMAGEHKDGTFQSDEAYLKYYQEMDLYL